MILNKKQTTRIVTLGTFFAFLIFGFTDNLKGPLLPVLLEEFSLSYAQGSNILLMLYLGFMLSILGSGFIAGKYGNRYVLFLSGIIISAAIAGMSLVQEKVLLYPLFFSIGIALGGIEIGANGAITDIYHENSGKYLNLLSVFHGAGSMAAPWIVGILLEKGIPWQTVYKGSILPILLLPLIFLFLRFTTREVPTTWSENDNKDLNRFLNPDLLLLALLIFLYVASEIAIASWIVDYLYKAKNFSLKSGSLMLTMFWGLMMLGRFIASFIVERAGYIKSLIITAILALLSFGGGILPGISFSYLLPLTGLFFAMIFPTVIAFAARIHPKNKHKVLSFLFFFAGLGGLAGPWVVGYSADWFGIAIGFPMIIFFIIGTLVILFVLKARLQKK